MHNKQNKFLYPLLLFCVIVFLFVNSIKFVNASPIFPRDEIRDKIGDQIVSEFGSYKYNSSSYGARQLEESLDIRSVDYFSDGKTLFATMWLGGPVMEAPYVKSDSPFLNNSISKLTYGVLIDSDSNVGTGRSGVDYGVEMSWTEKSGWGLRYTSYSTFGDERKLYSISNNTQQLLNNYTNHDPYYHYVYFPINLDIISSPNQYKMMFYTRVEY